MVENGGEGLILRELSSYYSHGRSSSLLKLKASHADQEAIVVDMRRKLVQLQMPNGMHFTIPAQSVQVPKLSIGDVVTFSYENYSRKHVPANAIIHRVRDDLSWQNVVNARPQLSVQDASYIKEHAAQSSFSATKWSRKKMRLYLVAFAKNRNLDPLVSQTWRTITEADLSKHKRGQKILGRFKGYASAIKNLFPNITLHHVQWHARENRKEFFEKYAKDNSFDPLNHELWYAQPKAKIMSLQGAENVMSYYAGSVTRALADLFPSVKWSRVKIGSSPWHLTSYRRRFFEQYATTKGFDPLNPENWYTEARDDILANKDASQVLLYHGERISKALLDLFPEIGLDKSKLLSVWYNTKKRKQFFVDYARANGFDPLHPENWYAQPREKIMLSKGANRIVYYHNDSLSQALVDLFPNIGLALDKLWPAWSDPKSRRALFEYYAKEHGFDPLLPENWYEQPRARIMAIKGMSQALLHHKGKLSKALSELFPNIGLDKSTLQNNWRIPL